MFSFRGLRCLPSKMRYLNVISQDSINHFCQSYIKNVVITQKLVSVMKFSSGGNAKLKTDPLDDNFIDNFYDSVDYDTLSNGDEELLKKLKIIVLEVEVMRQNGERVPSKMKTEHWADLLSMPTKSQRIKLLSFLAVKERRRELDKKKHEEKKIKKEKEREERRAELENNNHIHYGFQGSTIFIRVYENKIDNLQNQKLVRAMMFGQELVIDCGYDDNMNLAESGNCAKQLGVVFAENRKADDPFNLHFVNANRESKVMRRLSKIIPTMYDPSFPINLTEKHYLDLFPKEKLVYLTPHCREDLEEFNYDDIYIVGAMVDKVTKDPLSLAKAKAEGLRVAKFPLDRYLSWCLGSKSLTINQVLSILLDLKSSPRNWEQALRHVPRRKINENEEPQLIKRLRYRSGISARGEDTRQFKQNNKQIKWGKLFKNER